MSETAQNLLRMSAATQKRLNLPENFQLYSAFPFAGMNQQAARTAIGDQEFFWLENFLKTGPANLRTLWDRGTALYTVPPGKTIVYAAWFNVGATQYVAIFLSDGTAVQVQQDTGTQTDISTTASLFYTGGQLPFAQQSGSKYLLICNNNTQNDYWIWDSRVLYSPGSIGPFQTGQLTSGGSGYTSVPTVNVFGGSGSGVGIIPVINNGSVVSLTITNPGTGYLPGEVVQVGFSGGGSDTTPELVAVLSASGIASINLIAPGTGYTNGVNYAIAFGGGGGGSGAAALFDVVGTSITNIRITANGSGYTSTPTVSFAAAGAGTGATAVAIISPSTVSSITIINGGTNMTGTPLITITGGGGSGATGVAVMASNAIASVTITNGGSGYTSVPGVIVQAGNNNAASGTLELMPFGISGTSLETFLNRVWISNPAPVGTDPAGGLFAVSAPASLTDFATSDGGLLFTNSDRFLREDYVGLRQSNGYLYTLGDSSVSVINNVQTGGSPTTTTFNYQNTSSQIGASWRDSVQDFKQGILFGNPNGIQGLYGGAVKPVSDKMLNLFDEAVFPPTTGALLPSSAVANIHTIPCYLLLMTVKDPTVNQTRNVMVTWNETDWSIASQTSPLTFICTQIVRSKQTAWGTDGTSLFPLFATPSSLLTKKVSTKLYGGEREFIIKSPMTVNLRVTDKTAAQTGVSGTITMEGSQVGVQVGQAPFVTVPPVAAPNPIQPNFTCVGSPLAVWNAEAASLPGTAIGLTFSTTSEDFLLQGLSIGYRDLDSIFN